MYLVGEIELIKSVSKIVNPFKLDNGSHAAQIATTLIMCMVKIQLTITCVIGNFQK